MKAEASTEESIEATMLAMGRDARAAVADLSTSSDKCRSEALTRSAEALRDRSSTILEANAIDMQAAKERGLSHAMLDRLELDDGRLSAIAEGLTSVASLPDPLGRVLAEWTRPNGLDIRRVSVPLGVIGIIYESRPNVTADAAALCLKSGNAAILRGGSESFHSNSAIQSCLADGIRSAGLPAGAVQLVPTTDRSAVGFLLSSMGHLVDVVVPRGGRGLIERVQADARVPVIGHLEGLCHVFVHASADPAMAERIVVNAKMRRTGICGAAETILVDDAFPDASVAELVSALAEAGCEVRGDSRVQPLNDKVVAAVADDWTCEYLDAIVSVRSVAGLDGAIDHIANFGSGHTDCIVANDEQAASAFLARVDSAIVLHNASTQFADGGEFGMGAEIGIATGRIHARGPVGANELTSYKYVVRGDGQVRP